MSHPEKKTLIKREMRMADLVFNNPALLLLMENLEMDFLLHDYSVATLCEQNEISEAIFIMLGNIYNGHYPAETDVQSISRKDLLLVIEFLKRCHRYYKEEQYPAISNLISELQMHNKRPEIRLAEKFFAGYFDEVLEHLDYEDEIAFPYICRLLDDNSRNEVDEIFSVKDYREHHTDIESKLSDLKALLLQHIEVENDRKVRRRLLMALAELENDLVIHSLIEEQILIPVVESIERSRVNDR